MKPNFALDLADDTITLLHRGTEGWLFVGKTPYAREDLPQALAALRQDALALAPEGITSKIVIPNSQILYSEVSAPGPSEAERIEQIASYLEKVTPYSREQMLFDWTKTGDQIMVAAVARETLDEAEGFAVENGFNPLSFVAKPEKGFRFEPWFGRSALADQLIAPDDLLERDFDLIEIEEELPPAPAPAVQAPLSQPPKAKAPLWVEVEEDTPQANESALEPEHEAEPETFVLPAAASGYSDEDDELVVIPASEAYPSLQSMFDSPADELHAPSEPLFDDIRPEDLALDPPQDPVTEFEEAAEAASEAEALAEQAALWQQEPVVEPAPEPKRDLPEVKDKIEDVLSALPPPGTPFPLDLKAAQAEADQVVSEPALEDSLGSEAPFAHVQDPLLEEQAARQEALIASDEVFGASAYGQEKPVFDPAEELAPADFLQQANAEAAAAAAASGERRIKIDRASRSGSPLSPSKLIDEQADYEQPPQSPSSILLRALAARRDAAPPSEVAPPPQRLRPAAPPVQKREPVFMADNLQVTPDAPIPAQAEPISVLKVTPQFDETTASAQTPLPDMLSVPTAPSELSRPEPEVKTSFSPAPPLGSTSHAAQRSAAPIAPNGKLAIPADQRRIKAPEQKPSSKFGVTYTPKPKLARPETARAMPAEQGLDAARVAESLNKSALPNAARGKPKYLALMLIAGLLLVMALVAAWASLSDDQNAQSVTEPQAALTVEPEVQSSPLPEASTEQSAPPPQSNLSQSGAQQPATEGTAPPDQIFVAAEEGPPPASEAAALPQPNAGPEAPPETPTPPPPFGTVYSFDEQGLLVPQKDGILSPDGYTLFEGKPKRLPPARPEALAPQAALTPEATTGATPEPAVTPLIADNATATPLIEGVTLGAETMLPPQPNPELSRFKPRARPEGLVANAPPGDGAALSPSIPSETAPAAPAEVQLASFVPPQTEAAQTEAQPETLPLFTGPRPQPRPQSLVAAQEQLAAASLMANQPAQGPEANVQDVAALGDGLTISLRPMARPRNFAPPSQPVVLASTNVPAVDAAVAAAMKEAPPQRQKAVEPPAQVASAKSTTKQRNPLEEDELDEPEVKGKQITASTKASVAKRATQDKVLNLSQLNLIGIFGSNSNRYAMVRSKNGKFTKVKVGDKLDGGRVQAITQTEVRYQKGKNIHALSLPKG